MSAIPEQFCLAFYIVKNAWIHHKTIWVDVAERMIFVRESNLESGGTEDPGGLMIRAFDSQYTAPSKLHKCFGNRTMNRWATSASQLKAHERDIVTHGRTNAPAQFRVLGPKHTIEFPVGTLIRFDPIPMDFISGRIHLNYSRENSQNFKLALDLLSTIERRVGYCKSYDYPIHENEADIFARLNYVFQRMSHSQIVYKMEPRKPVRGRRKLARMIFAELGNKRFVQTSDQRENALAKMLGVTLSLPCKNELRFLRQWQSAQTTKIVARIERKHGELKTTTKKILQMLAFTLSPATTGLGPPSLRDRGDTDCAV